jgi:CheY-like chemotaxis protein
MNKNEINILIVDDEESSRQAMSEVVARAGFKTTVVAKAENALNSVRIKPVHAAIIDCMLPKMNGVQLAQELRKSRFGDGPIIFVSGIFKDKAFAQDAINKTQAKEYFTKPISNVILVEVLERELARLIDVPKVPLHALLSKPYASDRERVKALESIDEISGLDLPLIISILLDAESSGFLNLATENGDISGINFNNGFIDKVDTAESGSMLGKLLVDAGFLTTVDFDELPEKQRWGDVVKNLIAENLISPHASGLIKKDQIIYDLEKLVKESKLQINFVPERVKSLGEGVSSSMLDSFYYKVINKYYPLKWLEEFYSPWLDHPMRLGPDFSSSHEVYDKIVSEVSPTFLEELPSEKTIEELLQAHDWDKTKFYRLIHLIALRRLIIFDDVKRAKGGDDQLLRLKTILRDIDGKDPFEIFKYFGAGGKVEIKDAEKIYKEFARANHPDRISSAAPDELKSIVNRVYALVSDAYDIVGNEGKRDRFIQSKKQKEAEKQMISEKLTEEGLELLRRGKIKESLAKLNESIKSYPSDNLYMYWSWATIKAYGDRLPEDVLKEVQKKMDRIKAEDRRNPVYLFVSGLVKKVSGDLDGALAQFDKALSIDPGMIDVRREIASLRKPKDTNSDTFTGELTSIVGRLFKKQTKK